MPAALSTHGGSLGSALVTSRSPTLVTLVVMVSALAAGCGRATPPDDSSAGASSNAAPPFEPVADVRQLMQAVVEPNAWVVWEASGTIITATETVERRPQDEEAWEAVRNSAVTLTEAGNLLMMSPRARDNDEWIERAKALIANGRLAWKAAEGKDVDALFQIGGDLYEACLSCHRSYGHANERAPM
jgi:hypothetical protein